MHKAAPLQSDFIGYSVGVGAENKRKEFTVDEDIKTYRLGFKIHKTVGDEMFEVIKAKKRVVERIIIDNGYHKYMALADYGRAQKDRLYEIHGTSKQNSSDLFLLYFTESGSNRYLKIDEDGNIKSSHLYDSYGQVATVDYIKIPNTKLFSKVDSKTDKKDIEEHYLKGSFSYSLIYNGKDSDNIKIQYREFKDDMARAAFFSDLSYNLKDSKIIRYKNLKIEVLKATNEGIDFVVLED